MENTAGLVAELFDRRHSPRKSPSPSLVTQKGPDLHLASDQFLGLPLAPSHTPQSHASCRISASYVSCVAPAPSHQPHVSYQIIHMHWITSPACSYHIGHMRRITLSTILLSDPPHTSYHIPRICLKPRRLKPDAPSTMTPMRHTLRKPLNPKPSTLNPEP
jgi:hypothetical protein